MTNQVAVKQAGNSYQRASRAMLGPLQVSLRYNNFSIYKRMDGVHHRRDKYTAHIGLSQSDPNTNFTSTDFAFYLNASATSMYVRSVR